LRILIEDPRRFSFELTADFWIVGTVPKAKVMVSSKYLPKSTKIAMDSAPKGPYQGTLPRDLTKGPCQGTLPRDLTKGPYQGTLPRDLTKGPYQGTVPFIKEIAAVRHSIDLGNEEL
jgi:hypothetical protein